jgi:hypothetical protein
MRMEILAAKGQLAEHKKKYRELDIDASGLVEHIRMTLSPYERDVTELQIDKAAASMKRLVETVNNMRELKIRIAKLEADLG